MKSSLSNLDAQSAQPSANDVLLGRASHIYNHPGNIRYRCVISSNHKKYHACKTRLDKMIFIRQITKDILNDGAVKFWRIDKKSGNWEEVDFRTVQDKVSHALRDSKSTMGSDEELAQSYNGNNSYRMKPKSMITTFMQNGHQALEPRSSESLQQLQEMKRKLLEDRDRIDMVRSVLQHRQRNLPLLSMSSLGVAPNMPIGGGNRSLLSMIRDLPQPGLLSSSRPNLLDSNSSLMNKYGLSSFYS